MAFALVLWLTAGLADGQAWHGGGLAVVTFASAEACERARVTIVERSRKTVAGVCVARAPSGG